MPNEALPTTPIDLRREAVPAANLVEAHGRQHLPPTTVVVGVVVVVRHGRAIAQHGAQRQAAALLLRPAALAHVRLHVDVLRVILRPWHLQVTSRSGVGLLIDQTPIAFLSNHLRCAHASAS